MGGEEDVVGLLAPELGGEDDNNIEAHKSNKSPDVAWSSHTLHESSTKRP